MHDVMAAMTTSPWSSSNDSPLSIDTGVGFVAMPAPSSGSPAHSVMTSRRPFLDVVQGARGGAVSVGPASDGTTVDRSSDNVSA